MRRQRHHVVVGASFTGAGAQALLAAAPGQEQGQRERLLLLPAAGLHEQLFEIVGLEPEVVALCFPDTPSRIGGVGFARLDTEAQELTQRAWNELQAPEVGGLLKYCLLYTSRCV